MLCPPASLYTPKQVLYLTGEIWKFFSRHYLSSAGGQNYLLHKRKRSVVLWLYFLKHVLACCLTCSFAVLASPSSTNCYFHQLSWLRKTHWWASCFTVFIGFGTFLQATVFYWIWHHLSPNLVIFPPPAPTYDENGTRIENFTISKTEIGGTPVLTPEN